VSTFVDNIPKPKEAPPAETAPKAEDPGITKPEDAAPKSTYKDPLVKPKERSTSGFKKEDESKPDLNQVKVDRLSKIQAFLVKKEAFLEKKAGRKYSIARGAGLTYAAAALTLGIGFTPLAAVGAAFLLASYACQYLGKPKDAPAAPNSPAITQANPVSSKPTSASAPSITQGESAPKAPAAPSITEGSSAPVASAAKTKALGLKR